MIKLSSARKWKENGSDIVQAAADLERARNSRHPCIEIDPCLRCGFCCDVEVCALGQEEYNVNSTDKCPGLYEQDGKHHCRLIEDPSPIKNRMVRRVLGVGNGCPWYWRCNDRRIAIIEDGE